MVGVLKKEKKRQKRLRAPLPVLVLQVWGVENHFIRQTFKSTNLMSHTQYPETKLLTTIPAPPDLALLKPWVLQLDYSY